MVDFKTCPDCGMAIGLTRERCSCGYSFATGIRTKAFTERRRKEEVKAEESAQRDAEILARRTKRRDAEVLASRASGTVWPFVLLAAAVAVGVYAFATLPSMSPLAAIVAVSGFLIARRVDSLTADVAMLQAEVAHLRGDQYDDD